MFYRKITPSTLLQPYVETFYVWESSQYWSLVTKIESPPSGFGSIVFNYGKAYSVDNGKSGEAVVPGSFLTGQATRRYQLNLTEELGVMGIVFKPSAIYTLLGIPMYEFNDERVALVDIFGKVGTELEERVRECLTTESRVALIEDFLIRKFNSSIRTPDKTDYVANLIKDTHGMLATHQVAKEAYISTRQFQRSFLLKVGISAKYYARISRMSQICKLMASKKWNIADWHDIVHRYGYYDQSHFIKEFAEFMGQAPTGYTKSNLELGNYVDASLIRAKR